jgi:diguanylate cyclase (GGDEF)-like protein
VVPSLLAAAVSLVAAGLTWRRSRAPGLRAFLVLCAATAWWSVFHALDRDAPGVAPAEYMGLVAAPLAWLAFTASYAGRGGWLRRPAAGLLLLPAIAAVLLVWAGGARGPAWTALDACRHLAAFAGAAIALGSLTQGPRPASQKAALLLAALLIAAGHVLEMRAVRLPAGLDPLPAAYALAALAGIALFRPRLLHLVPVARSLVVEGLADGVIVLDGEDRIVDCNSAAEALLSQPAASLLGSPARRVLVSSLAGCLEPGTATRAELLVGGRAYEASVTALGRSSVAPEGRVMLLREVTELRRAEQELTLARVELQHANAELQHLAHTDPLTGLRSRRFFLDRLAEEVARTRRHQHALSLLMVDLDRFKLVNDRWGHVTGDQILATVAALLRSVKRETDLAGRLGGEEFAMMLPATDAAGAHLVAERLIARLRAEPYDGDDGTRFSVTASIGLATLGGDVTTTDGLMASAGRALHVAQEAGGDRVAPDAA